MEWPYWKFLLPSFSIRETWKRLKCVAAGVEWKGPRAAAS